MRIAPTHAVIALQLLAAPLAPAQRTDTAYARVTYVSASSVYIDAGSRDGLADSAAVDVVRARAVVARLRVRFLATHRAQCDVVQASAAPLVGDSVRFLVTVMERLPGDTIAARARPSTVVRSASRSQAGLHGRLGMRYLASWQRDSGSAQLSQPSSDIRLDGPLPGTSLLVALDARGRRTIATAASGVVAPARTSTLLYQASVSAPIPGGMQLRVGRQYSGELSSVSLFDGMLFDVSRPRVTAGAFAGTQPDFATMGFSTRIRQYGAYAGVRGSTPDVGRRWSLSVGGVGSYDAGQVDREFGFVSAAWTTPRVSAYVQQELDYNRGWKRTTGAALISPTSTYGLVNVRLMDALSFQGGYDTRRGVPLYRNYITPEITFDDTFRTGVWAGLSSRLGARANLTGDVRHSYGGPAGVADVYTLTASEHSDLLVAVDIAGRASYFATPSAVGWMPSLSASVSPLARFRLELLGGARFDTPRAGTAAAAVTPSLDVRWVELDADVAVGRAWYVLLSATMTRGGWESSDQLYSALSYRF